MATIKGKIIDSVTGAGIPYATIQAVIDNGDANGGIMENATAAKADGSFSLATEGDVLLITSAEYIDNYVQIDSTYDHTIANLPLIRIVKQEGSVIVTATPPKKKNNAAWLLLALFGIIAVSQNKH